MPRPHVTDQQVKLYMRYRTQHTQGVAAAKAGFSERTARRLDRQADQPSQRPKTRPWRTRKDPLEALWEPVIVPMLQACPTLMAVTIFEELQDRLGSEQVPDSVRRTLERRVRAWRAANGPEQDVIFPQDHPPGQRALSDFTHAKDLGVTIAGTLLEHRLFHFRLACSGWEHAEVILGGESFPALAESLQNALWRLGGVPHEHRTDSLSAAFHNLNADQVKDLSDRYEALCRHYGMVPTRNNRGEAHENGTVEAAHGHLKRRLDQALKRRGVRDFETLDAYRTFVAKLVDRHNTRRPKQIQAERPALKALPDRRTTDFTDLTVSVTRNSTIIVDRVVYSVPSRLIGHKLRIHLYDDRLQAYLGADLVFETARLRMSRPMRGRKIDYRHVIKTLRRKPQAFRNYVFRDELFPHQAYRRAWHALEAALPPRQACKTMVGLLDLAASQACEDRLAQYLDTLLNQDDLPDLDAITALFVPDTDRAVVAAETVTVLVPDLTAYDQLLPGFSNADQHRAQIQESSS